jgi:hypothetical protein
MSYDSDFESIYLVEFESGKTIHLQFFDVQEVKEYCKDEYSNETIKHIYKEVYAGEIYAEVNYERED